MSNNQSSKSRYSQRKQEISQAVQRHNNNRGRIAQRGANKEYKKAKVAYREAAKNYREGGGAEALKLKKKSKENLRIARKTKKIVKKTNPTNTKKITRAVAHTGTSAVTSYISSGLSQDEDLEEIVKHTRTSKNALRSAIADHVYFVGHRPVDPSVGMGNRRGRAPVQQSSVDDRVPRAFDPSISTALCV